MTIFIVLCDQWCLDGNNYGPGADFINILLCKKASSRLNKLDCYIILGM